MVSGPQGPRVLLDGKPRAAALLEQLPRPRRPPAGARGRRRGGDALGRRRRRVAPRLGQHDAPPPARGAPRRVQAAPSAACCSAPATWPTPAWSPRSRGQGDVVFSDALNHASIVDGCRLARAETFVYDHRDIDHLEWGLRQARGPRRLIVTDGVFSMDGDVAPLAQIVELARRYDARVMVDEAHATGRARPRRPRRGRRRRASRARSTWSSARSARRSAPTAPTSAATPTMAKYLVNTARTLIFSTAPPPPVGGRRAGGARPAARAAAPGRRACAATRARCATRSPARASTLPRRDDPDRAAVVGDAGAAMRVCERALERGVFAQAIRPPTVPDGTSRLRLAVMASHTPAELRDGPRRSSRAALRAGRRPGAASDPSAASCPVRRRARRPAVQRAA